MSNPLKLLRDNIVSLREKRGWNQAELARQLKWDPGHLSAYMTSREPGLDKVAEIAAVFGLSISELFKDKPPAPRIIEPTPIEALRVLQSVVENYGDFVSALSKAPAAKQDVVRGVLGLPRLEKPKVHKPESKAK